MARDTENAGFVEAARREPRLKREHGVLAAVSLALILAQSIVFASFGLLLFAMSEGLDASAADVGFAYTLIVIGACVGAAIPVPSMRWVGAGPTIIAGQIVLAAAFLLLVMKSGIIPLYLAATLAGIGFSLSANTPAVYLISGWTGERAPRFIGIYMMIGMLGNAVGPPVVQALIGGLGWQGYAVAAAIAAAGMAGLCLLCLREPPHSGGREVGGAFLRDVLQVVRSPIFLLIAGSVVLSQTSLVTVASVAPAHLGAMGLNGDIVARLLGIEGLASAAVTGLLGFATSIVSARRLLPAMLIAGAMGMMFLAMSRGILGLTAFALLTGASVGGVTLAATLLLVDYFGSAKGAAALGAIWTLAGLAAFGPWGAGFAADTTGSYAPALLAIGIALLPMAAFALLLPRPPEVRI